MWIFRLLIALALWFLAAVAGLAQEENPAPMSPRKLFEAALAKMGERQLKEARDLFTATAEAAERAGDLDLAAKAKAAIANLDARTGGQAAVQTVMRDEASNRVRALLIEAKTADEKRQTAILQEIALYRAAAVPSLELAMQSGSVVIGDAFNITSVSVQHAFCAKALAFLNLPESDLALERGAKSEDPLLRSVSVQQLHGNRIEHRPILEGLIEKSPHKDVVQAAVAALAWADDLKYADLMVRFAREGHRQTFDWIVRYSLPRLFEILRDRSLPSTVRSLAAEAVRRRSSRLEFDKGTIRAMVSYVVSDDPAEDRICVAEAAEVLMEGSWRSSLENDPEFRREIEAAVIEAACSSTPTAALHVLAGVAGPKSVAPLLRTYPNLEVSEVDDSRRKINNRALRIMVKIGTPDIETLREFLSACAHRDEPESNSVNSSIVREWTYNCRERASRGLIDTSLATETILGLLNEPSFPDGRAAFLRILQKGDYGFGGPDDNQACRYAAQVVRRFPSVANDLVLEAAANVEATRKWPTMIWYVTALLPAELRRSALPKVYQALTLPNEREVLLSSLLSVWSDDPEVCAFLLEHYRDISTSSIRTKAIDRFRLTLYEPATAILGEELRSNDVDIRRAAKKAFDDFREHREALAEFAYWSTNRVPLQTTIDELLKIVETGTDPEVVGAARALSALSVVSALPALSRAMKRVGPEAQKELMTAITEIPAKAAKPAKAKSTEEKEEKKQ